MIKAGAAKGQGNRETTCGELAGSETRQHGAGCKVDPIIPYPGVRQCRQSCNIPISCRPNIQRRFSLPRNTRGASLTSRGQSLIRHPTKQTTERESPDTAGRASRVTTTRPYPSAACRYNVPRYAWRCKGERSSCRASCDWLAYEYIG